jgi:molecular chaperone GrpE
MSEEKAQEASVEETTEAQVELDIDALLADTQRERDEYLDLAKRTKADFENFRKRISAEVQAASARGRAEVIREVVPVLDDLERAIQAAGLDPEGDSEDAHEALSTQPADGVESGTVVEVMQKGYRLGEQLIRPARVVVSE